MPQISTNINGVTVKFAKSVVNNVDKRMIDGINHCIKPNIANGYALTEIYISSAYDSHKMPSRHMQHKAVDISRINGMKIVLGYPLGGSITAIVDAIQASFEGYVYCRENFGPHIKKKIGLDWAVPGHNDHIHLSVN